jgi:hypothetical protein
MELKRRCRFEEGEIMFMVPVSQSSRDEAGVRKGKSYSQARCNQWVSGKEMV